MCSYFKLARPFGDVFVNGFDFDIELNNGYSQYYPAMIAKLRELFKEDPDNAYYITGAPQCPIPEPNSEQLPIPLFIPSPTSLG